MNEVEELAERIGRDDRHDCARCGHKDSDHCKGGVSHSEYKEQSRQWKQVRQTVCATRHCDQPLCSCVEFMRR